MFVKNKAANGYHNGYQYDAAQDFSAFADDNAWSGFQDDVWETEVSSRSATVHEGVAGLSDGMPYAILKSALATSSLSGI